MNILIVGYYTEDTVDRIKQVFPEEWKEKRAHGSQTLIY